MSRQPRSLTQTCQKCHQVFSRQRTSCGKLSQGRRCPQCFSRRPSGVAGAWSGEEITVLSQIVGFYQLASVGRIYRRQAKKLGLPHRSDRAILSQLQRMQLSARPTDDNWNCSTLAEALGISYDRVRGWVRRYPELTSRNQENSKRQHRIQRANFKVFARQHPNCLAGIDPSNLKNVLGQETALKLLPQTSQHPACRKFYCNETGVVCSSPKELLTAIFPHLQPTPKRLKSVAAAVRYSCKTGGTAYGHHWEFIDHQEKAA